MTARMKNGPSKLGPYLWMAIVGLALAVPCGASSARAQASSAAPTAAATKAPVTTKVTYVTETSVYVDAGSEDGLNIGDKVEILRDGAIVAVAEVTYTSPHKAVCGRVSSQTRLQVGDGARYTPTDPHAPVAVAKSEPVPAAPAAPRPKSGGLGLHGRVGVRYFWVKQSDAGFEYRQPQLDLRLDGTRVFGTAFDLGVDMRARRTYRTVPNAPDESEGRNRVYSAFVAWHPKDSPFRVALGRQFAASLGGVSIFDGALVEYRRPGFGAGVFSGAQPDPVNFGLSSDIKESGAFVEFGNQPGSTPRWLVTTGAVTSSSHGEVNRDYLYLQGLYDDTHLSLYALGEVDVYRGWRKEVEGKSMDLTSGSVSARYRTGDRFSINAGFDDRRNVRLYRDFISPETEFDDSTRRGYWAGFDTRVFDRFGVGVDARRSDDGAGNNADSYTLRLRAFRLTSRDITASTRSTRYTNERLEGWLHSLSVSADLGARMRLGLNAGTRSETAKDMAIASGRLNWVGVDFDVLFSRHWMFLIDIEKNSGQSESNQQLFATLTYRF